MKKPVFATVVLLIATALLLATAVGASASIYVKQETFERILDSYTELPWNWVMDYGQGDFASKGTLYLDGHAYEIGIVGRDGGVSRVYFFGWFEDMKMLDEGMFSDGLMAYNDFKYACQDFVPDDYDFEEFFSSYDIYWAVLEGSSRFDASPGNWRLESTSPGRLAARHSSGCTAMAERRSDGTFWFEVTF